jgi:hypothetical protein
MPRSELACGSGHLHSVAGWCDLEVVLVDDEVGEGLALVVRRCGVDGCPNTVSVELELDDLPTWATEPPADDRTKAPATRPRPAEEEHHG